MQVLYESCFYQGLDGRETYYLSVPVGTRLASTPVNPHMSNMGHLDTTNGPPTGFTPYR